jgi:uncharacterized protein (DUF2141 family)
MDNHKSVSRNDTIRKITWVAVLALGIFMTFFRIGNDSLWYDESYSVAAARHTVAEMIPIIADDSHPPLYYLMLRAVTLVLGNSETAVRSLSAIGLLALAGLGFFPLRKLFGNRGGLVFSLAVLFTPMSIAASHEARMYTWLAFFVTAEVIAGFYAQKKGRARDWIALSVLTLGASYTHYYGLMASGLYWLILAISIIARVREAEGGKRLRAALVTACSTLLAYAPWIACLARQASRVAKNYWIPPVDVFTVFRVFAYPYMQRFSWNFNPYAIAIFLTVLTLGVIGVIRAVRARKEDSFLVVSALSVYALTFLTALVLSVTFKPILYERYFIAAMGLLILCFSYFVHTLSSRRGAAIAIALYALASLPVLGKIYTEEVNGPLDIAKADLAPRVKPGDIFVHGSEHTLGLFRYAFPNNEHYLYIPEGFVPFGNHAVFAPNASFGSDLTRYNDKPVTIWLTGRSGEYYTTPIDRITSAAHRKVIGQPHRYSKAPGWLNITVYEVAYDPDKTESNAADAITGTGTLSVTIEGVKPALGGKILYALYDRDPIGPNTFIASGAADPTGESVTISIEKLPYGTYALTVFHDVNNNFAPDFKKGKPVEGIAFGIDPAALTGPLSFADMKFDFTEKETSRQLKIFYPE